MIIEIDAEGRKEKRRIIRWQKKRMKSIEEIENLESE